MYQKDDTGIHVPAGTAGHNMQSVQRAAFGNRSINATISSTRARVNRRGRCRRGLTRPRCPSLPGGAMRTAALAGTMRWRVMRVGGWRIRQRSHECWGKCKTPFFMPLLQAVRSFSRLRLPCCVRSACLCRVGASHEPLMRETPFAC